MPHPVSGQFRNIRNMRKLMLLMALQACRADPPAIHHERPSDQHKLSAMRGSSLTVSVCNGWGAGGRPIRLP